MRRVFKNLTSGNPIPPHRAIAVCVLMSGMVGLASFILGVTTTHQELPHYHAAPSERYVLRPCTAADLVDTTPLAQKGHRS